MKLPTLLVQEVLDIACDGTFSLVVAVGSLCKWFEVSVFSCFSRQAAVPQGSWRRPRGRHFVFQPFDLLTLSLMLTLRKGRKINLDCSRDESAENQRKTASCLKLVPMVGTSSGSSDK